MSESKTILVGSQDANLTAMLPALLQKQGLDSGTVMGLINNANNRGGLLGNNGLGDIIALIIVASLFGNGNGNGLFGGGNNNQAATTEREMLMQALQRNGVDIGQLAQSLNVSTSQIMAGINQVANSICGLGNQMQQNTSQILTAMLQGNNALTSQLASCCCDLKQIISQSNYLTERGFCNTNQILTKGFSDIGYAFRDQTCNLEKAGSANTAAIIAKLDAIEDSRKDRELAEKDRMIATLTARSERQAELQPIYNALKEIQCNQPPVKKIACPETYVPVNRSINENYGLIPACGFNAFAGWNGVNCNGSLWG